MASDSLEQQVGEQSNSRGVDNLQSFHPFWSLAAVAVRGKNVAVSGI